MKLCDVFSKILCINRASRTDRWEHCKAQALKFDLALERFEAIEIYNENGLLAWNSCTASHKACLEIVSKSQGPVLILEDDFKIRFDDFHQLFRSMFGFVPADWDLLYLGGHYGNAPLARVAPCVLHCNRMMGLSSYGITPEHAARIMPHMRTSHQADCVASDFALVHKHYIFQPRLIVQYESFSDLCQQVINPEISMTDTCHENMI